MSKSIKHVGRHGEKKVIVVYRQIPNEEHMCLVLYSDMLPHMEHDEVINALESPVGQQANELADALFRVTMANGVNCLEGLHRRGLLKKVATSQIVLTPNAKSSVRLDELNKILNEMKQGDEAIKRLAELDANSGLVSPKAQPRELGENPASRVVADSVNSNVTLSDVLTDEQLAAHRVAQATRMRVEAERMIQEAARLEAEASAFVPKLEGESNEPKPTEETKKK